MELAPKQWSNNVVEFVRETRSELKKVTWPTREEVVGTTAVVLGAVIFFGLYLWVCDIAFYEAIDWLFKRFKASA